jgi:cytochrome P450
MLALMDPPQHTQLRHALNWFFTPRRIQELRDTIAREARTLVAHGSELGEFDFAVSVAQPLTVNVTLAILGVPTSERGEMLRIVQGDDPDDMAHAELLGLISELAEFRRERPGDDMISALCSAKIERRLLTEEEIVLTFSNLLSGGVYTTSLAAAGGLQALMESPQCWEEFRSGAVPMEDAVEEILRWTAPVVVFCRTANRDTTLGGRRIKRHDRLAVWLPSLNRDESVFPDPDVFRLDRRPNRHATFSGGGHTCIGAGFARLELQLLFDEMLRTWKRVEAAGPAGRYGSLVLRGFNSLPVRVLCA